MSYSTQNQLLLNKLMEFYKKDNNIDKILPIIHGISLMMEIKQKDLRCTLIIS